MSINIDVIHELFEYLSDLDGDMQKVAYAYLKDVVHLDPEALDPLKYRGAWYYAITKWGATDFVKMLSDWKFVDTNRVRPPDAIWALAERIDNLRLLKTLLAAVPEQE